MSLHVHQTPPTGADFVSDLTKLHEIGVKEIFLPAAAALQAVLGNDVAAIRVAELRALAHANPGLAARFLAEEERRWSRVPPNSSR